MSRPSSTTQPTVAESFAYCEQLARSHNENFPVGSLLIPKAKRQHVYSIYAFARTADDIADEGYDQFDRVGQDHILSHRVGELSRQPDGAGYDPAPPSPDEANRLRQLDEWQTQLEACYEGRATHPIFVALSHTVKELRLEPALLRDLLSAFKQDVTKRRYADFAAVTDYCARSANPVGRLILRLFDYRQPQLDELSDAICTGLQLANFWQDVAVDILKDRVYLPQDEMAAAGVTLDDLRASRASQTLRDLLRFQVERARDFFARGKPLPDLVSGRLAIELRLTWHGGMRILELIEQQNFDTLAQRPKLNAGDKFRLLTRALFAL